MYTASNTCCNEGALSSFFCFLCSNGENVEGATHKQVVDLIKSGGDTLTLTGKEIK